MSTALFEAAELAWFLFLVSGLFMMYAVYRLSAVLVERGRLTVREQRRFAVAGSAVIVAIGLGVLAAQLVAGVRNPGCLGVTPGTGRVATALDIWLNGLAALFLWWVWRSRSFRVVVQLASALISGPETSRVYSRRQVQVTVTVALVATLVLGHLLEGVQPPGHCDPGSEMQFQWRIEMPTAVPREA